jgi:16S rRNA (guanine527-N7)-methyltransferase
MSPPDSPQFAEKHFWEASIYTPYFCPGQRILDIGSGGGFPGIPLAIMNPQIEFILLDKRERCTRFLQEVIQVLRLDNVSVITARAEDLGKHQLKVDSVIARAVSRVVDVLTWSMPVLKDGGFVILGKKPEIEKEATQAEKLPFTLQERVQQPFGLLVIYRLNK